MGSFSTSLSGLNAQEEALSVIANDLANLNTTAFKSGTPVFSDLFYQMLGNDGAGNPVQVGVGAKMSSVASPFTQGNVSSTGVPTDVAIEGNGLFIVDHNGTQVYTRAGNFTLSPKGNLTDSNGNHVMGYPGVNGAIDTSRALAPVVISMGQTYSPNPTSTVQLDMNLDAADTSLAPAIGTLTVPAPTLPTAGQTATIGGTTYTFAAAITPQSAPGTVLIGADAPSTLANLAGAINASATNGQAAGTTYSTGTTANPLVTATATANVLSLQAVNAGTVGNSLISTSQWTAGSFAGADLTGGVNDVQASGALTVPPPVPTAGQTITIGGTTYTFATAITAQTAPNTVKIGTDVQSTLANLAGAVNASSTNGQAAGTTYSSGTVANTSVTATGTTATTISLQALSSGAGGNSLTTTSQWTASSFGAGDLVGGANAQAAAASFAVPPGTQPNAGDTVSIGGTTYKFVANSAALSAPNDVAIGGNTTATLANLMAAINADATQAGVAFTAGTVANGAVTATGSSATTVSLQAFQAGINGNALSASTSWLGSLNLSGGDIGLAADATFTVPPATQPNVGDTFDVGGTTYTFVANSSDLSAANTVLIGSDVTTTLANLAGAINIDATGGQAAGTTYGTGTVANGLITATGSTATTLALQALATGVGGNAIAATTNWTADSLSAGNLTGGADALVAAGTLNVAIPLPTPGQSVTVGGTVYTFAANITGASPANTVKIGTDVQSTLANLAGAINASSSGGQAAGTTYSSGTVANTTATATATATTINLQAIAVGTAGNNAITTLSGWTGGNFGAANLTGGVDAAVATGAYSVPLSLPAAGQTVTVGATTYTFVGSVAALTTPDSVLIGTDVTSTLANLAGAINASSTNGQGAGATYGTGTVANTAVTATASTPSTLALQAITGGSVGNATATSTTWKAGTFAAGDLTGGTDAGKFNDSIMVYDSLGNSHVLTFNFTKTSAGNWDYRITIPAADVGAAGNPQVVASGTLQFDASGKLVSPSTNVTASVNNLADGASTLDFKWELYNPSGGTVITQTAEASATSAKDQNGYSAGTLQSYSIDSTGVIQGVLSNDQTVSLGQIALATFPNYDGLTKIGSNNYQASLASGAATVGIPGSGGRGTLEGSSLEGSNVDIATEFTALIQAERGYEANAKAITTADNVIQASIALIRG